MRYLSHGALFIMLLVASAQFAAAGEAAGNNIVVVKPATTTQLPNGMTYTTTGNSQVCLMTDPDHPLNDATGDCDGACVGTGDSDPACMGSCTWVDSDGDIAFFTWEGNGTQGTWKMENGTGKWAAASGSGTWETTGAFTGGLVRNSWSGSIEMD